MLPEMSGWDVMRALRPSSQVPVIMLTARDDPTDKVVGLELGADDYVVKPFDPKELLARVRAVLRRMQPPEEKPPLTIGNLVIDPARHEVRLGRQANRPHGHRVRHTSRAGASSRHGLHKTATAGVSARRSVCRLRTGGKTAISRTCGRSWSRTRASRATSSRSTASDIVWRRAMLRSMRLRLVLAFVAADVAVAIGIAEVVAERTATRQFDAYVGRVDAVYIETLTQNLGDYYAANGSWQGVESVFEALPQVPGHLQLQDNSGAVVGDTSPGRGPGGPGGPQQLRRRPECHAKRCPWRPEWAGRTRRERERPRQQQPQE